MAQTKKKRRRKRKGTQGGRVDTSGRRPKPRSREEAKAQARARPRKGAAPRFEKPPSWRSATIRGVVAAALFFVLLIAIFGQSVGSALAFGLFMLAFYIPAGYYIDLFVWRRRERARMRSKGR